MLANSKNQRATRIIARLLFVLLIVGGALIISGAAQTGNAAGNNKALQNKSAATPVLDGYKNVKIGMTSAQVVEKLGKPESEDAQGLYYSFGENETAQFILDSNKNVRTIVVMFMPEHPNPMKFEDVFGKDAAAEPAADGKVYKLVRYPEAGYWIAYNRMAGEKAMITLTIQKM